MHCSSKQRKAHGKQSSSLCIIPQSDLLGTLNNLPFVKGKIVARFISNIKNRPMEGGVGSATLSIYNWQNSSRIIFPVKKGDFSKTQNLLIHPSSDTSCCKPVLYVASQFFKLCKKETVNGSFFCKVHLNYLGTFRKQGKCHNFCIQPVKMLCWRIIFLQNEPPSRKQFLP